MTVQKSPSEVKETLTDSWKVKNTTFWVDTILLNRNKGTIQDVDYVIINLDINL